MLGAFGPKPLFGRMSALAPQKNSQSGAINHCGRSRIFPPDCYERGLPARERKAVRGIISGMVEDRVAFI